MILSLLAVLDGGVVEPPARVEVPVPDGTNADVVIVAKIRKGRVELEIHYEVGLAHGEL